MKAFLWWEAPKVPEGAQWLTMEHGGVFFPEKYAPHGVKMNYNGKPVDLTPAQEECATFFAAVDPNGMHLGNPKTGKIFINNFFTDFKEVLGKKHVIKDFDKCDFTPITRHLDEQKMVRKAITDGERKANKAIKDEVNFRHGYAIVDGHIEKVGNYNMEPPGTFRGRGEHPKMGKVKQRVTPEQVYMNFSVEAPPPICDVPGHAWGEVRHDPFVQWLGNWKENINFQDKYMQLAAMSSFKGKSDRSKYNKAARLCGNIEKIRSDIRKNLKSNDKSVRQLATAMWVIDRLALRVGGEKDTDEEADTVGCCSLRVEHMSFNPNNEEGSKEIELEFLGKDSMLFKQTIDFGSDLYNENNGMGEQVYKNFQDFTKGKKATTDIFETLTPGILNQHLSSLMPGLSAKVFRTYNASITLQNELAKKIENPAWKSLTVSQKVTNYNDANRIVAILCNHQRSVSKAQETQLDNMGGKLKTLQDQKKVLKKILKILGDKDRPNSIIPLKQSEADLKEGVDKALADAKKMKEAAKTDAEKIEATKADLKAKEKRKDLGNSKFSQAHLWEKVPNESQVAGRIKNWSDKISKMSLDLKNREDNKEVSLGTSKINYMDPRISVAFCKENEVPIERIFSKTLRDKFNWAMSVEPAWQFNYEIGLEN
ncbi:hypothetical protein TrRE_jg8907 [Triparma retinervis]|uniref:DNA topoisomerase 1 n=1 Tax=Triparma retinervis TaxID=2557542 RepID=A0A9W7APZ6_9STRA|nr:hypothetical protein TrRE_jg8907 [Triparma retinervis]